jgi:peroxiredoxin (alkyl hydroperoxide reductase subunit C)
MKTVGEVLEPYQVTGVRPGFNWPEENRQSAFIKITEDSFKRKWKVFYFYPKDFTFICPSEIEGFASLEYHFRIRNAVLLGGNMDNEFVKLAWRRDNPVLSRLNHFSFSDPFGALVDQFGVRDLSSGFPLRATFVVDEGNVIRFCSVNDLNVGRGTDEVLRVLDGLQTKKMCMCNRPVGGVTL